MFIRALIVSSVLWLPVASSVAQTGRSSLASVAHGKYWQYVPRSASLNSDVLVVCHGMLSGNRTANEAALEMLKRWANFADQAGSILIAPLFDDENFGAGDGCPHGWGYRGLYGRHVGADEFLHEIISVLEKANPKYDGRFYLYGFSAGAQFAGRYVVTHPERVHAVVIASGGWLPIPSTERNWPRGMGRRRSVKRWPGAEADQVTDVQPDPKKFLAASKLPILVTKGSLEVTPVPGGAGPADTHGARLERWVKLMNQYAAENEGTGGVNFMNVPNIGHDAATMTRACMPFVATQMLKRRAPQKRNRTR